MNGKTILGIGLSCFATIGLCCAGGMGLLGIVKRMVPEESATAVQSASPLPVADRLEVKSRPAAIIPVATKELVRLGDVQVWIVSVSQVEGENGKPFAPPGSAEKSPLFVRVRLVNKSRSKKIDYTSWQKRFRGRYPHMTDEHGNTYRSVDLGILHDDEYGHIQSGTTGPGESIEDVLVFEGPLDIAHALTLELSADAFGHDGTIRFVIPLNVITLVSFSQIYQKRQ